MTGGWSLKASFVLDRYSWAKQDHKLVKLQLNDDA